MTFSSYPESANKQIPSMGIVGNALEKSLAGGDVKRVPAIKYRLTIVKT